MKITPVELIKLTKKAKNHSIKMQNRLLLYWAVMTFVIFAAILVVMSFAGVFSNSEEKASHLLELQQQNTYTEVSEQFTLLTAKGIYLSEQTSEILEGFLFTESVSMLSDNPEMLERIETILYGDLDAVIHSNPCNGAYIIFDATINTKIPEAEKSRAGIYLRLANISGKNEISTDVTLFRGIPAVARKNGAELHNRWKLEFDISAMPGYDSAANFAGTRLADGCFWTEKMVLPETWENIIHLKTPIVAKDGSIYGVCGIEVSEFYFRLSHPAVESEYGSMVTVLAPIEKDELMVSKGMVGSSGGTYIRDNENLIIKEGEKFNTYIGRDSAFIGTHQKLDIALEDGSAIYAVTLLPAGNYLREEATNRITWGISAFVLFVAMIFVSFFLAKKFVRPIAQSLAAIQENKMEDAENSGISEIDSLLSFIEKNRASGNENSLPSDIEELFTEFAKRAESLTPTERSIIKYYSEGKEVSEIPELCFISINTVRKHNANIYKKLGVGSKEELMLYVELFRRCGRFDELL